MNSTRFHIALLTSSICLSFGLVSCSKNEDQEAATPKPIKSGHTAFQEITLYSWGEYFDESLLERFEKQTGIHVNYQDYESSDEMREELKSNPGKYDVVVIDDLALERLKQTRIVRKLNKDYLSNFEHIDTKYVPAGDISRDELYSVPYFWGTTVVAYNKSRVSNVLNSWQLMFDPKLKEHVFFVEERMECTENMLRMLGYPSDTENPQHLQEAGDKLLELVNSQKASFGSDADGKAGLLDGSIWAAMVYNGDLAQALQQDQSGQIGYFYPKEGTTTWVDNFTVPRDTPRWKEAHQFINYMMDPVVAAESSIYVRFATANKSAREHLSKLDPELLESAVFPDDLAVEKCRTLTEGSPTRQRLIHESWQVFEKALVQRDGVGQVTGSADGEESMDSP